MSVASRRRSRHHGVRLGEAQVEPEGVLGAEVARPPGALADLLHDAAEGACRAIRGVEIADGHDDLDGVAALAGAAEATEVGVIADRRVSAPEAEQALPAAQHQVAAARRRLLLAYGGEAEAPVEALRDGEIRDVKLDEDVRTRRGDYGQATFPSL
ncbi:MAG TPA: hypothetical protein VFC31_10695 [Candidatus Limnocylindria bacterium]|nr:hypothetical protein [Candidatus Limnocylindria bacterium]